MFFYFYFFIFLFFYFFIFLFLFFYFFIFKRSEKREKTEEVKSENNVVEPLNSTPSIVENNNNQEAQNQDLKIEPDFNLSDKIETKINPRERKIMDFRNKTYVYFFFFLFYFIFIFYFYLGTNEGQV